MSQTETESSRARDKNAEAFSAAMEALRHGGVIVFPTETFYGLGADALNPSAVEHVFSLKGRSPDSPIAVIIANRGMLNEIAAEIPPPAEKLIGEFWPGPLTLVLPAKKGLPGPLLNRDGKIGVRISSHPMATRLAKELGCPITATSANPSRAEPARTAAEARSYFSGKIEVFLDGGRLRGTKGSSVVEISGDEVKIIRDGEISARILARVIASSRG